MMAIVETYLATRRAGGFDLLNAGYLSGSFACFAAKRNETHIRAETAIDWAALGPSVAQRDARLKTVCRFARYIRAEDGRHELPPANYFGNRKKRPVPYIYSTTEITHLIDAALGLGPRGTLRAQTYATLIALLASTGLRISEALHLRLADITVDGLLIRNTKFGKTRLVPLHETAAAGLGRYLVHRHQAAPSGDHVFIGRRGQSLRYQSVQSTFKRLAWKGRRPREVVAVLVGAAFVTHSLCGHFRIAQRTEIALANIWSPWRPIWATSTSTRRIGTSKLRRNFCAISPTTGKRSCVEESNHDADRSPH